MLGVVVEFLAVTAVHVPSLSIGTFSGEAVGGEGGTGVPCLAVLQQGIVGPVILVDIDVPPNDFR